MTPVLSVFMPVRLRVFIDALLEHG